MKPRIRPSSASSRTTRARDPGGALVAQKAPHERVVPRVRGVAVLVPQELVETVLGRVERSGHLEPEPSQPRRPDRDKQRLGRRDAALEIAHSLLDGLLTCE